MFDKKKKIAKNLVISSFDCILLQLNCFKTRLGEYVESKSRRGYMFDDKPLSG